MEDLTVDLDGTTIQSLLLRSYHNGRSFNDEILAILREAASHDPVLSGDGEYGGRRKRQLISEDPLQ